MKPRTAYRLNLWMAAFNVLLIGGLTPFVKDAGVRRSVTEIFAVNIVLFLMAAGAARTIQQLRDHTAADDARRAAVEALRP